MPKFRRDVQPLLERSIDSLTLGIELFNRPTDTARAHAVPMLLHHAFELVLKAAILQRGRRIHDKASRYTFGFDKCLAVAEEELRLITKDERATLSILDAHRDTAAHFYAEISERRALRARPVVGDPLRPPADDGVQGVARRPHGYPGAADFSTSAA